MWVHIITKIGGVGLLALRKNPLPRNKRVPYAPPKKARRIRGPIMVHLHAGFGPMNVTGLLLDFHGEVIHPHTGIWGATGNKNR